MPGLHITRRNVFGNIPGLCQQGAEVLRRSEVVRIALCRRAEAAREIVAGANRLWCAAEAVRGHLDDRGVDDIRSVISQQVLTALAVELIEAEAVRRTNHRPRIQLV